MGRWIGLGAACAVVVAGGALTPSEASAQVYGQPPDYRPQSQGYGSYGHAPAYGSQTSDQGYRYGGFPSQQTYSYGGGYGSAHGNWRAYRPPYQGHTNRHRQYGYGYGYNSGSRPAPGYRDRYGYNDDRHPSARSGYRQSERQERCDCASDVYFYDR